MNTGAQIPVTETPELATVAPRRRLSIALVVHDLHDRGGHSLYTKILADDLSRRHQVAVFTNSCEQASDTAGDAAWDSYHVKAWRGSALATVYTFPLGLRRQAAALNNYAIRHAQGYCGGQPNVVTAHICVAAYLKSLRGVSLRNRLSLKLMAAAESRFYRHHKGRVIAVSQKLADELQKFYDVPGPISVIPHGVDRARFNSENRARYRLTMRASLGLEDDDTLALYVGDLTKSHVYLKELAQAAPEVQFVVVTSSQAYHWRGTNVRIVPPTSELARYYAAADAFVFPTTYDAFGMVLLEAMASGLPVFSSDQAGAAELIATGEDGFVTPLNAWVEATADGLRNRGRFEEVGRAAEHTARRHDWAKVVGAVERIYFEIADEH